MKTHFQNRISQIASQALPGPIQAKLKFCFYVFLDVIRYIVSVEACVHMTVAFGPENIL